VRGVAYDAGALIAGERNDRRFWAEHCVRLEAGMVPIVPSVVVAQVSRSAKQVGLRRLLRGCEVAVLDETAAHRAGELLARSRTSDVVDAALVDLAAVRHADIVTGDRSDIERLASFHRRVSIIDL
jgi:hypothetical protein